MDIHLKRAYATPSAEDGRRVLVDRLWPRGLSKDKAALDLWLKEVAPSNDLRHWFGHDPARWEEFVERYRKELGQNPALQELLDLARQGTISLIYGAKDEEHNQAVVLRDMLKERF